MSLVGPGRRYRCAARIAWGADACDNARTARAADVEARLAASLRSSLLHPRVVRAAAEVFEGAAGVLHAPTAEIYRGRIERLEDTFQDLALSSQHDAARHALARVLGGVRIFARPGRGQYGLEIDADLPAAPGPRPNAP